MALSIVILAAGQGTRMRSDLPKVLQPVASRPLLGHVVDCAKTLGAEDICIVYGHGAELVKAAFPEPALRWALKDEPPVASGRSIAIEAAMVRARKQ